jgi:hypothetical protein
MARSSNQLTIIITVNNLIKVAIAALMRDKTLGYDFFPFVSRPLNVPFSTNKYTPKFSPPQGGCEGLTNNTPCFWYCQSRKALRAGSDNTQSKFSGEII